jgi:hypothetical protein
MRQGHGPTGRELDVDPNAAILARMTEYETAIRPCPCGVKKSRCLPVVLTVIVGVSPSLPASA